MAARTQAGVAGLLPLRDSGRLTHLHMAFRGHFEFSLDAKNRLTLPAKLRASFSGGLVLAKGIDPCAAISTPEASDSVKSSSMHGLHPLSADGRRLIRFFNGGAFD